MVAPRTLLVLTLAVVGLSTSGPVLRAVGPTGSSTFSVGSATAETGDTVSFPIVLDHGGPGLSGWSLGLCHPEGSLAITTVAEGSALITAKNGAPPDFHELQIHPGGFASGVVVCFTSCATLAPGSGLELYVATYDVTGLAPQTVPLEFCETLGTPPVPLLLVFPGGSSLEPAAIDGGIEISGPLPLRFRFALGTVETLYDPDDGLASVGLPVTLVEEPASAGSPNPVTGFTVAIGHDAAYATAVSAVAGADLAAAGGGLGPDTFLVDLAGDGLVVSATIDASAGWLATSPQTAIEVQYDSVPATLAFNFIGRTIAVEGDPTVTVPPTAPSVQSPANLPVGVLVEGGAIEFIPRQSIRRGDANDDAAIDIGDVPAVLGFLFTGGSLSCLEAADSNDDAQLDIGDPIWLLGYLFSGGPPPPAPFPGCGFDVGAELGCSFHGSCP